MRTQTGISIKCRYRWLRVCCSVSPFDPSEQKQINTLPRRSASNLRAEQHSPSYSVSESGCTGFPDQGQVSLMQSAISRAGIVSLLQGRSKSWTVHESNGKAA